MVEKQYPNLMILDKELVRRSWYINKQAVLLDSSIFSGVQVEKDNFLENLKPFEESKPFNGDQIELAYRGLLEKILREQLKKRPVYLGYEFMQGDQFSIPSGYQMVPVGFWLKVVPVSSGYVPAKIPVFHPVFPENWKGEGDIGYYSDFIRNVWNSSCRSRAQYEASFGKNAEAQAWAAAVL
jgi:hypothetical protein